MIFSRFFTPPYASRDPQKRIKAIAELSPQKAKERSALHELAFNDSESEVSLAALEKLDSFPLWLKMSQTAKDERVQRRANRQVEQTILNTDCQVVSAEELTEFLLKQAPVDLAKKVLLSNKVSELNQEAVLVLLDKVGTQAFITRFFFCQQSDGMKIALINRTTDDGQLTKWQKKSHSKDVLLALEKRIEALKQAREKPIQIEKKATLALSKLQALTERFDYQDVVERRKECETEFEGVQSDFAVLCSDVRHTLENKYQQLKDKVHSHEQRLKDDWEAKALQQRTEDAWKQLRQDTGAVNKEVEWLFSERLSDATLADVSAVNDKLRELENRITTFSPDQVTQFSRIAQQISSLNSRLARFNEQQQAGQRLLKILTQAENEIKEDKCDFVNNRWAEVKSLWQLELSSLDVIPAAYKERWNTISQHVQRKKSEQQLNEKKATKEARRLLSLVSNLHDAGRYRQAIARFRDLSTAVEALPPSVAQQFSRRYDTIAEAITRLADWQADIAAPKKPALLAEAQALASTEAENIADRAKIIKLLRQQWQSLTIPGEEDPSKAEFDDALEAAFAPCRAFYAAQEQERQKNALVRLACIEEMEKAAQTITDHAQLAKVSEKLKQQWRQAGSVEQSVYENLRERWDSAAAHVNRLVSDWHGKNRQLKKAIIEKAKMLLDESTLTESLEQAKLLQQEWKTIGSAGRRHDTKLWQLFKETNDIIFQRAKARRDDEMSLLNDQVEILLNDVKAIAAQSITSDEALEKALEPILEKMSSLHSGKQAVIQQRVSKLRKAVKARQEKAWIGAQKSVIHGLLSLLNSRDAAQGWDKNSEAWASLPKSWREVLTSDSAATGSAKPSEWYLTQCEILVDLPSPEGRQRVRSEVQMTMMADKLQHGDDVNLAQSIKCWFASSLSSETGEFQRMAALLNHIENDLSLLEKFAQ